MNKRGLAQVSLEYMMVVGVILIIILPAVYLFFEYSKGSEAQIKEGQIQKLGSDIVNAAELVYFHGKPSRIVVKGTLPENIVGVDVISDWSNNVNQLVFYFSKKGGVSHLSFSSNVNISGYIGNTDVNSGLKSVLVSAQETVDSGRIVPYVSISFKECGDGNCDAGESYMNCFEDCGGPR